MRLLHQSDKLILRHSGGKYVICNDFWNDGSGIYDQRLLNLSGDTVLLGARLAADGRLKFSRDPRWRIGEHKNRAVPVCQIASIRTQREVLAVQ